MVAVCVPGAMIIARIRGDKDVLPELRQQGPIYIYLIYKYTVYKHVIQYF